MRKLYLILITTILIIGCDNNKKTETITVNHQTSITNPEISFGVRGNCGMCKTTIQKAALSVDGVEEASWGIDTKILDLKFKKEFDVEAYKDYLVLREYLEDRVLEFNREMEGQSTAKNATPGPIADGIMEEIELVIFELDSLVKITPNLTLLIKIHEAIAKSGYDTGLISANDEDYNNLPGCCQYNREMEIPSKN